MVTDPTEEDGAGDEVEVVEDVTEGQGPEANSRYEKSTTHTVEESNVNVSNMTQTYNHNHKSRSHERTSHDKLTNPTIRLGHPTTYTYQ